MDPAPTDDDLAELADVVLRISREVDPSASHALDIVPLTGTEALVMRWIDRHQGTSPSATAEATGLQRSNLSAALRALVAKDMVDRRPDPDDARLVQLFSTARATESIAVLHARWAEQLRRALGTDHAGVATTLAVLTRIDDGLRD
ncbi:MarR family winged helix-turn-helix transcriptional regulator [Microbacterium sp. M1A1_1b]|uniref:MarR family winged helix-turn-helix transcriptional regulator n=1 Tax=Curtobacterium sp. VKM Ac-2922 TaxID=2929475 RepID=UPI001FB4D32A|nr:MarR family transcriptional regulator [Curtobacterium sp. VKM Ac-2922]MCJ1715870.1 MarR family transcriptional regulator [Curtobacterium sp. VKM Ac-2922]